MKKGTLIVIAVCLLFAFSACGEDKQMETKPTEILSESLPAPLPEAKSFPITFTQEPGEGLLKSGKLVFTITDAQLISSLQDLPAGTELWNEAYVAFFGEEYDNGELYLQYPDFIEEDGRFRQGAYLILLDITVKSENAENYTKKDLDEDGYPNGIYDDPFLFRADAILSLQDTHRGNNGIMEEIDGAGQHICSIDAWGICYFSDMNKQAENYMAYRLEPGESISFHIGFMVSDIRKNGQMDLNTLYLTKVIGDTDAFITRLDFRQEAG